MQDRKNNAHLSEIATLFKDKFGPVSPLHWIAISGSDNGIGVVIFFRTDSDITKCETNGTCEQMRTFIYDKLEEFGRGRRSEIDVSVEFDSFENVEKNFEGSYFLRMR